MNVPNKFVCVIFFLYFTLIPLKGLFTNLYVVAVYQCSISNVMYTGDIEAYFVVVHAGLDWQVHTHYGIPLINASLLPISR